MCWALVNMRNHIVHDLFVLFVFFSLLIWCFIFWNCWIGSRCAQQKCCSCKSACKYGKINFINFKRHILMSGRKMASNIVFDKCFLCLWDILSMNPAFDVPVSHFFWFRFQKKTSFAVSFYTYKPNFPFHSAVTVNITTIQDSITIPFFFLVSLNIIKILAIVKTTKKVSFR